MLQQQPADRFPWAGFGLGVALLAGMRALDAAKTRVQRATPQTGGEKIDASALFCRNVEDPWAMCACGHTHLAHGSHGCVGRDLRWHPNGHGMERDCRCWEFVPHPRPAAVAG